MKPEDKKHQKIDLSWGDIILESDAVGHDIEHNNSTTPAGKMVSMDNETRKAFPIFERRKHESVAVKQDIFESQECDLCSKRTDYHIPIKACKNCIKSKKYNKLSLIGGVYVIISLIAIFTLVVMYSELKLKCENMEDSSQNICINHLGLSNIKRLKYTVEGQKDLLRIKEKMYLRLNEKNIKDPYLKRYTIQQGNLRQNVDKTKGIVASENISTKDETKGIVVSHKNLKLNNIWINNKMHNIEKNNIEGFWCITEKGISLWQRKESTNIFENRTNYFPTKYHGKGVTTSDGKYIVGGYGDEDAKIYYITSRLIQNPPTIELLNTFPHNYFVFICFKYENIYALCADWDGEVKKYNLLTLQQSNFYYKSSERFYSGIQLQNKLVIIGSSLGKLYILDKEGNEQAVQEYRETQNKDKVWEIAEIRENIIITADGTDVYLHNINNLQNIISSKLLDSYYTDAVISLSRANYFAIGGGKRNSKGFLDILYLLSDNTIDHKKTRTKDYLEGAECTITTIKEMRSGIIIFGGYSCTMMCIWDYGAFSQQIPLCWQVLSDATIVDFVPLIYNYPL